MQIPEERMTEFELPNLISIGKVGQLSENPVSIPSPRALLYARQLAQTEIVSLAFTIICIKTEARCLVVRSRKGT